ncbi:MAG: PilZ domain-containing protein [Desulfovibrionaceae bacterium]
MALEKNDNRRRVRLISKRINYITIEVCGKIISCAIINLSCGGIMVKLPTDMAKLPIVIGTTITFRNVPEKYKDLLEGLSANVVWFQNAMCGICFESPLPCEPEELQALLDK